MSKTEVVHINDSFRVTIDSWNHTLEEFIKGGNILANGKFKGQVVQPSWALVGYYPTMEQCLRQVRLLISLRGGASNLDEYITRLEYLFKEIK